jgi:hypothetical protein
MGGMPVVSPKLPLTVGSRMEQRMINQDQKNVCKRTFPNYDPKWHDMFWIKHCAVVERINVLCFQWKGGLLLAVEFMERVEQLSRECTDFGADA